MKVDPAIYHSLFEVNADGKLVLEELCRLFYDRQSYVKGDTHETAFNEGKKYVIQYLLNRLNQQQQKEGEQPHVE